MLPNERRCQRTLTEKLPHGPLTAPLLFPQGTDFHPKYTGENLTCTVQGLKRSSQYKFRVSEDDDAGVCVKKKSLFQASQRTREAPVRLLLGVVVVALWDDQTHPHLSSMMSRCLELLCHGVIKTF